MIPVKQKYLHNSITKGDCWRACIASILEYDIDALPDPNFYDDWNEYCQAIEQVVKNLGYDIRSYSIINTKQEMLNSSDTDGYVIAVGASPRFENGLNHCVVWKNGVVHDPYPDPLYIQSIVAFDILTKIK